MNLQLERILYSLMKPEHDPGEERFAIFDPAKQFNGNAANRNDIARSLNASFLILLAGKSHPLFEKAISFLSDFEKSPEWDEVVRFYSDGIDYIHTDGLIMRHDKEAFAQEAIKEAQTGKIIGDYLRMLYYSAYANILSGDETEIKKLTDPFTGAFISRIPITIVYLRFALKAASLFASGKEIEGVELVTNGAKRLAKVIGKLEHNSEELRKQCESERAGWNLYYDILEMIERALRDGDDFALNLRLKSRKIMQDCAVCGISRTSKESEDSCRNDRSNSWRRSIASPEG